MNIDQIINELKKLNNKAIKINEIPISAILVKNNTIVAKEYNTVEKDNSILSHAEIKCIKKESKKINNWRLDDYTLYVTLEPCDMCKQIIKKSRIKKVVYFIKQNDYKTEKQPIFEYVANNELSNNLSNYFKLIRK